jgi:predicted ATPase
MKLVGRHSERATLDGVVEAVRSGGSQALLLCGEAGVGGHDQNISGALPRMR